MIDYVNELREGCLEAYTGILMGFKGDKDKQVNRKTCCGLLEFMDLNGLPDCLLTSFFLCPFSLRLS